MDLSLLNEAQQQAVTCIDSPSLVIAGAGSGKTRVLTYKIAYLLEQGYQPWSILALTFTNKAAREMQSRIAKQVDATLASSLWMGTFHSIFSRILRIESAAIGFTSDFTIYDAADSKSLIKTILRELNLDDKTYKPATVCSRISDAKNRLVFPDTYRMNATATERDSRDRMPAMGEIYMRYMQRCRLSNAMDFDDLLLYTFYLFEKNPDILKKYEEKFEFVLVDEYQDTNYAQHRIVWQLTQHRQRVCVVGDDAQSIYSFRGANIDNILHFQEMYNGARLFKLERNYRSTQNIVNAANSLISHNRGQIRKESYSEKIEGKQIRLFNVQSDFEESIVVSHRIQSLHQRDHYDYSDIAILYRTNSQSRSLEDALRKISIPYHIYGGMSFYQRKEIKDVIAYLRLALNPRDEEALKRVINYPARGIGDTTLMKVLHSATMYSVSPWQVIMSPESAQLDVNKGTLGKLTKFAEMIMGFHACVETDDAYTLAKKIVNEAGVTADINSGHEPEDVTRQENLQELLDGIAAFVQERQEEGSEFKLADYLQEVSLVSDLDSDDKDSDGQDANDKVTLMTIHSAKGLEFRIVFVVGLEEELFPSRMAMDEGIRGLEEERRLMYVAMTRAEEQLYLSTAKSRFRYGKTEMSSPSRFLKEIDSQYISSDSSASSSGSSLFGSSFGSRNPSFGSFTRNDSSSRNSSSSSLFGSNGGNSSSRYAGSNASSSRYSGSGNNASPSRYSGSGNNPSSGYSDSGNNSSSGYSGGNSSSSSSASKTGGPVGGASAIPPSLWGKTLRRVGSIPTPPSSTPSNHSSGPAQSAQNSASGALAVGCIIEHSRFGRGKVISIEGSGLDTKALVEFDNVGRKQLLLRFAKFNVIG